MASSLDLVGRSSELARVFGIEFNAVLMRGSQYRVESMMIRMARTQNFLVVTRSKAEVAEQPAMDSQPLVMEPSSGFYTSPVVVLDFQSLYPSQIIAYNICYSTCLGKVPGPADAAVGGRARKFGAYELKLPKGLLPAIEERVHVTPNGAPTRPPAHPPTDLCAERTCLGWFLTVFDWSVVSFPVFLTGSQVRCSFRRTCGRVFSRASSPKSSTRA